MIVEAASLGCQAASWCLAGGRVFPLYFTSLPLQSSDACAGSLVRFVFPIGRPSRKFRHARRTPMRTPKGL